MCVYKEVNIARFHVMIALLLILSSGLCHAQNDGGALIEKRYNIFFRINSAEIEPDFNDNAHTLETLKHDAKETFLQNGAIPDSIVIIASASPDGRFEFNRELARNRASNTRKAILEMFPEFKNSYIEVKFLEEDWDGLLQVLKSHPEFPQREEMIAVILDDIDPQSKEHRLKSLNLGWSYLTENHLHALRNSSITLTVMATATNSNDEFVRKVTVHEPVSCAALSYESKLELTENHMSLPEIKHITPAPIWQRHLHIKTNTLGLGLAISNLGCEIDIAKHFSIAVPIYYSALNYFTETIKFRTLATQPEIRYWTNQNNNGLFFGVHGGVAQYNIAVDGDLRYQDHDGTSPALGAGIGLGYRLPISDDNRWHIEFAIGAGIYKLHYDTFHNVHNGKLINTYHDVYYSIDNAAINISYRFDLKKRKQ